MVAADEEVDLLVAIIPQIVVLPELRADAIIGQLAKVFACRSIGQRRARKGGQGADRQATKLQSPAPGNPHCLRPPRFHAFIEARLPIKSLPIGSACAKRLAAGAPLVRTTNFKPGVAGDPGRRLSRPQMNRNGTVVADVKGWSRL
jgi:hypothetical protein